MSTALVVALLSVAPSAAQVDDPFVGNPMCIRCHEDVHDGLVAQPHGGESASATIANGCQSCHGPGRAHVQNPNATERQPSVARMTLAEQNQLCSSCHSEIEPFDRTHGFETHSCSSCHTFHTRASDAGILSWQAKCIGCHSGNAVYDELHAYDAEKMESGEVSCRSCHQRPAHR